MAALITINIAPNSELWPLSILLPGTSCMLLADGSSGWCSLVVRPSLSLESFLRMLSVIFLEPRPKHAFGVEGLGTSLLSGAIFRVGSL